MEYIEKRLTEIQANPPKAPDVTFDELLVGPSPVVEPLLPNGLRRAQHA